MLNPFSVPGIYLTLIPNKSINKSKMGAQIHFYPGGKKMDQENPPLFCVFSLKNEYLQRPKKSNGALCHPPPE